MRKNMYSNMYNAERICTLTTNNHLYNAERICTLTTNNHLYNAKEYVPKK